MLPRLARIIPPVIALATWGLCVWACWGDAQPDGDDYIAGVLAAAATGWALLDFYYRKLTREHQVMKAGALERDAGVMAEGVAAFMRQESEPKERPHRELGRPAR
jgi:hypothetical protein